MKFTLFFLFSVLLIGFQSIPVVPYGFQMVCLQRTKACQIYGQCSSGGQTGISYILDRTGLSFTELVSLNPLLTPLLPSGSVSENTLVCVSGVWQGSIAPMPSSSPAVNTGHKVVMKKE